MVIRTVPGLGALDRGRSDTGLGGPCATERPASILARVNPAAKAVRTSSRFIVPPFVGRDERGNGRESHQPCSVGSGRGLEFTLPAATGPGRANVAGPLFVCIGTLAPPLKPGQQALPGGEGDAGGSRRRARVERSRVGPDGAVNVGLEDVVAPLESDHRDGERLDPLPRCPGVSAAEQGRGLREG